MKGTMSSWFLASDKYKTAPVKAKLKAAIKAGLGPIEVYKKPEIT